MLEKIIKQWYDLINNHQTFNLKIDNYIFYNCKLENYLINGKEVERSCPDDLVLNIKFIADW